jgi:hypothetical protein
MCKYFYEEVQELPMGPLGKNQSIIRKCNKTFIDKNGNTVRIKECWHFKDFAKCEYFENKEKI